LDPLAAAKLKGIFDGREFTRRQSLSFIKFPENMVALLSSDDTSLAISPLAAFNRDWIAR